MADSLKKSLVIGRAGAGVATLSISQVGNIVQTICGFLGAYGHVVSPERQQAWMDVIVLCLALYATFAAWGSKWRQKTIGTIGEQ